MSPILLCMYAVAVLVCLLAGSSHAMKCPTSPVTMHAGCQVSITFPSTSCDAVRGEISKRVNGQYGSWYDPHNNGTYSITDSSSSDSMSLSRLTGDKKYTDKMIFSYAVMASGGCDVTAFSESQVTSLLDYATNYCNVHNLYCSDDSCKPFTKLAYTETVGKYSDSTVASCFSA